MLLEDVNVQATKVPAHDGVNEFVSLIASLTVSNTLALVPWPSFR